MDKKTHGSSGVIFPGFWGMLEAKLGALGPFSFKLLLGFFLGIVSLLLFAKLSEDMLFNELLLFDRFATWSIRYFSSQGLTMLMKDISNFGSPFFVSILGVSAMIYTGLVRKHFWDTLLLPIAVGGGALLNQVLKLSFQRNRPSLPHLVDVSGYSFPSGHAMISFIFYGLIAYLIWVNFSDRAFIKSIVIVVTAFLILAIGISRIYLGVHYPSDVLAGYAAGSFWLIACVLGLRGVRYRREED